MIKERAKFIRFSMLFLSITPMLAGGFVMLDRYLDIFDEQPFDRVIWASSDEQRRGPMARDAARRLTAGSHADQVREMLGLSTVVVTGDQVDKRGRHRKGTTRWSYWLGSWSGMSWYGFDSADLDIYFDQEGRVIETEIDGG